MKRWRALPLLLVGLPWACGPDRDRGPIHRVYLDDEQPVAGETGGPGPGPGQGGSEGGGEAGAATVVPLVPPMVTAMMPKSGPYGTTIRITGEGLGSAARSGVRLLLGPEGERVLTPAATPEVLSWSENEIRFRFPFPYEGRVLVRTPLGDAIAGEFEPTWLPGPPLESVSEVTAIASVAHEAGTLAAVLDTGPPSLVTFDGTAWVETAIPTSSLREESIRLYTEAGDLRAFGLSIATSPVIVDLGPASDFAQNPSGVAVTTDFRVAGGVDGAAVWFRDVQWSRAVPAGGDWTVDKEMISDATNPQGKRRVAGATLDGSLYVGWGEDVGSFTDDRGVAKHRFYGATATSWAATTTSGSEVDDEISNLVMSDRGAGLVFMYCGTDEDPFDITASEKLCYTALLPGTAKTTMRESRQLRYAFGQPDQVALYCSPTHGLRLIPKLGGGGRTPGDLDKLAGDVVAWPCPNVVALEVDPDAAAVMMLEQEGVLYSPRPREP
jgi:hypothetical protein